MTRATIAALVASWLAIKPVYDDQDQKTAEPKISDPLADKTGVGSGYVMTGDYEMHPIVEAIVDALDSLAGYEPNDPLDLATLLQSSPEIAEAFSRAMAGVGNKLNEDSPVDSGVGEAWIEVGGAVGAQAESLADSHIRYEQAHEGELRRLREPRVNESFFDTTSVDA